MTLPPFLLSLRLMEEEALRKKWPRLNYQWRLNETGILSIQLCSESRCHVCSHRALPTAPAGSQLCLPVCWGTEGGSGAGGSHQEWQQGDNAPGKTWGDPGELTIAQREWGWSPANPDPHRGCGRLQLPARSRVITFAKLRRAQPLIPSPSPDSDGCPSFSTNFFKSELKKRKAQLSAVTQIA